MMRRGIVAACAGLGLLVGLSIGLVRAGGLAHAATPTEPSVEPSADSCPALEPLAPAFTKQSTAELRAQLVATSLGTPSMAGQHLEAIEGALSAYRDDRKDCMRKAMYIHTLASQQQMTGNGGRFWFYRHDADELVDQFLEGPLEVDLTGPEREDVVTFIEDQILPNLDAESDEDREHWRQMYMGGLLGCHATEGALAQLGGRRMESGCIDLDAVLRGAAALRRAQRILP